MEGCEAFARPHGRDFPPSSPHKKEGSVIDQPGRLIGPDLSELGQFVTLACTRAITRSPRCLPIVPSNEQKAWAVSHRVGCVYLRDR